MNTIRLISLVLKISIIGWLCFGDVKCDVKQWSLGHELEGYNELIQSRLESINSYLDIDFNTLTNYLYRLNDYLSFYSTFELADEQIRLDICLPNRTEVCWHFEDAFDIIKDEPVELPLKWLETAYHLNTINLHSLNLDSLNAFSLNNTLSTLNTTFTSLRDFATLDSLSSSLHTSLNSLTNIHRLSVFETLISIKSLTNLSINRAFFISYFDKYDNEELKNVLVSFNLFMPFVCSAFLFLLCVQNQHRRKLIELNQLFCKLESVSGLQEIKEDMRSLANVIDELKLDAKQNQDLKIRLQEMLNNEFKMKQQISIQQADNQHFGKTDVNGNLIKSTKGDQDLSSTFNEQIDRINQQLKLNQLEQSKLKYMVCKTIESFDRILNKMKNNCELINS